MSPARVRPFRRPVPRFAAIILTLGALALQGVAFAQIVKESAWVPDGNVRAVTFANGLLYVGGYFTGWGPSIPSAVTLDGGTGVARAPHPNVKGSVFAAVSDGNGGVYIGGSFTSVQGQARLNVAQLDASGYVTVWNPSANGEVDAIAVSGGVVYLGGTFEIVGNQFRDRVAAISAATGIVTAWNPGADSKVRFISVDGPRVYLGGDFTSVGGASRPKLGCIDAVTAIPTSWQPGLAAYPLTSMALGAGRLFAAWRGEIRVYDSVTGASIPEAPLANNYVHAMVVDPAAGTVYTAGDFDSIGGIARERIAAFDAATLSVLTWAPRTAPGINGQPKALAFASGVLYVGGFFDEVSGLQRGNAFAVDVPTATINGWDPRVGGKEVRALVADGTTVFAGGDFTTANMVTHRGLAAIDPATGIPTAWTPDVDQGVENIAVNGNTVYFVGGIVQVNGVSRTYAASVNATTGAVTGWNPTPNSPPKCLAVFGSTVYLGGAFSFVGGSARERLAAVDATTGAVLPFNPGAFDAVTTMRLIVPNDIMVPPTLYIGGEFLVAGGASRNRLAAINTATGAATSWNPNANGPVTQLNVFANSFGAVTKVYVAGSFTAIGGVTRRYIAELDGTGAPTAWIPAPNAGVACFATSFSSIYLGGGFATVGGQSRTEIAEVDLTTAFPTNWNPGTGGTGPPEFVFSITRVGTDVIVGGSYRSIGHRARSYFALIDQTITAVAGDQAPVAPSVVRATPNPFEGSTTLRFALPRSERADVTIYDTAGRLVRRIHAGALAAGEHRLRWDGTNDRGRGVASGIYFLSVRTPTLRMGSKIFRLR